MLKQIISNFERENKILISEEVKSEVYSMFDSEETNQEKVFYFIIKCYDKTVKDSKSFKYFMTKVYVFQTILIYILVLLFWIIVYRFQIIESYFTLKEFINFLLLWSPLCFIGVVITFIYMPRRVFDINKIKDNLKLNNKIKKYLIISTMLIILNFIIFKGAPWSLFAVTGMSGMFIFELSKVKYYNFTLL